MSKNSLAIDYKGLDNISYDSRAMVEELIGCIDLPVDAYKNNSNYTKQQKIEAIAVFIVVGKIRETARLVNIPCKTMYGWSLENWWEESIRQTQIINKHLINSRTNKIINLAFDNVEKRFSQGDYATYDHDLKEIVYKPVSAKDSAVIFGVMFDKQRINNSLATHITTTTTTHLLDIKAQFESMTNKPTIDADIVERIE